MTVINEVDRLVAGVAEWLGGGLQTRVHGFESRPRLQKIKLHF